MRETHFVGLFSSPLEAQGLQEPDGGRRGVEGKVGAGREKEGTLGLGQVKATSSKLDFGVPGSIRDLAGR